MKEIPFNAWSRQRIREGRKICTSRTITYSDSRVYLILRLPLSVVRNYLYREEGADTPEEFEKVWRSIFRGRFEPDRLVYVHFGKFTVPHGRESMPDLTKGGFGARESIPDLTGRAKNFCCNDVVI